MARQSVLVGGGQEESTANRLNRLARLISCIYSKLSSRSRLVVQEGGCVVVLQEGGSFLVGKSHCFSVFRVCSCSSNLEFRVGGDCLQRPRNPPVRWFVNAASPGEDSRGNAPWNQVRGG